MPVPFIGRRSELASLASLLRAARAKRTPTAALVIGEPGSGKSRLLKEAAASWGVERTVRVVGFETTNAIPLAAAGDLLRLLSEVPDEGPNLHRLSFEEPGRARFANERRDALRIFEAAQRALGGYGPLLVVIDDLQWVDERSVALLHYLLRAAGQTGRSLAFLAAARPSPAAATFGAALGAELGEEHRRVLELGPLPLEDGVALSRAIDGQLDDRAAADLWRRAKGSPFWLEALSRSRGVSDPAVLMGERLRTLTGDAGSLLAVLAVAARPLLVEEAAELLDWGTPRTGLAADELVTRGLVVSVAGSIRVGHDLIRESVAHSLPATARRRLAARLAEWLGGQAGDDAALLREALGHQVESGLPTAPLIERLLSSSGRRLLDRADLRLLGTLIDAIPPAGEGRVALDRGLGELAAALGDQELALDRWTRVSDETSDLATRQEAEIEAAQAAFHLRGGATAHEHLDRARAAPPASPILALRLLTREAEVELWLDHETEKGARTAERALRVAEEMATASGGIGGLAPDQRRAYFSALLVASDAALQQDRAREVMRLSELMLGLVQGLDEESRIAGSLRSGFALRPLGRPREAEARYRQAWDESRRLVLPTLMLEAGHGLMRTLRDLGRIEEARTIAAAMIDLEARIRNAPRRWGNTSGILHAIELALSDPATALRDLRHDALEESDPHYRLSIYQVMAVWQARTGGDRAAAQVESDLAAAREASGLARCPRCASELIVVSAEALARIGRPDAARLELAGWQRQGTEAYLQRDLWGMRAAAAIAMADGLPEEAVSILDRATKLLLEAGLLEDLIWAELDLGRALVHLDRTRAVAAFTSAARLAE
ncbi:MAG: ATP-binding protein, partial [Chloroflexota bacterium]